MTVSVCLSVSVTASISPDLHVRSSPIFVHMARSSSGGVAICYVLPFLWMTSYLYTTGHVENVAASDVIAGYRPCCVVMVESCPDNGAR